MKIKKDFLLRQVADTWVVIPLSSATVSMNGMLNLNDTGAFLWKLLNKGAGREELVDAVLSEYAVSAEIAMKDIDEFISKLQKINCLDV